MSDAAAAPAEPSKEANGNGNGHGHGKAVWGWLTVIGTVIGGAALSWTGVNSKLDQHAQDIAEQRIEHRQFIKQLERTENKVERLEGKIDRLLNRKETP